MCSGDPDLGRSAGLPSCSPCSKMAAGRVSWEKSPSAKNAIKSPLYHCYEAESVVSDLYPKDVGSGGYFSDGDDVCDETPLRRFNRVPAGLASSVATQLATLQPGCYETPLRRKKIFSLRKSDYLCRRKSGLTSRLQRAHDGEAKIKNNATNNAASSGCLVENDASCGLHSISGDRSKSRRSSRSLGM